LDTTSIYPPFVVSSKNNLRRPGSIKPLEIHVQCALALLIMLTVLTFQESDGLSPSEESHIKEKAIIYRKQSKRPLAQYHHRMNAAAQEICLKNPSMLTRRGDLQLAAQQAVLQSGYQFRKGHSRSKKLAGNEPKPKKLKVDKDLRAKRIQELKEDIKDCKQRIDFKEKRCEAASAVKNYKACDSLTEEIVALKARRREFEAELKLFERKEQKSKWYHRRKSYKSVMQSSESESDPPVSHSSSSTPMVPSDSEQSSCRFSVSSVMSPSPVLTRVGGEVACRELSPPCSSPLFSPIVITQSDTHQDREYSHPNLPSEDDQGSRGSTMVISSDSELPTSPSAPEHPSSSTSPSADNSFLVGLPVNSPN